jgi:hypothetical protein
VRASLIPLAKRVRAGRTLKLVLGTSAAADAKLTLGKTTRKLTLEAGATETGFKVPAKAKRGKQKLKLTLVDPSGTTVSKSVSVTVI